MFWKMLWSWTCFVNYMYIVYLHDLCKYDYGIQEHCYSTIWFWLHQALCVMVCPLLGYGCCVLRLRGGSHLQRPLFRDIDRNWELRAMPLWWEPPPESQFYWGMGAACYALVREPPPESLSLYVSPLEAHHSSHMPLGYVYGIYEMMAFGIGY